MSPPPGGRFQLDPRSARLRPGPPPTPPGAVADPPFPVRHLPPPTPTLPPQKPAGRGLTPRQRQRYLLLGGLAAAAILLIGSIAVFGFKVGDLVYPDRYLLDDNELPPGLKTMDFDTHFMGRMLKEELGMKDNPGQLDLKRLDGDSDPATTPKEAWAQFIQVNGKPDSYLTIVAARFASAEDARSAATRAGGPSGDFASDCDQVLLAGKVAVFVDGDETTMTKYGKAIMDKLRSKASNLAPAC